MTSVTDNEDVTRDIELTSVKDSEDIAVQGTLSCSDIGG